MSTCHCLIRHAVTPQEQEKVQRLAKEARKARDFNVYVALLASLNNPCPARK